MEGSKLSRRDLDSAVYGSIGNVLNYGLTGLSPKLCYSKETVADILEVRKGNGIVHTALDENQLTSSVKADVSDTSPRVRIYFFDAITNEGDRLPTTEAMINLLQRTYKISQRFIDLLWWQYMPGRAVHHDEDTQQAVEYELWYSAVVRSKTHGPTAPDHSRQVLGWQRMCAWLHLDSVTARVTVLLFRCPLETKQKICSAFQGAAGARLSAHPMLIQLVVLQHMTIYARNFDHHFSDQLYALEELGDKSLKVSEQTRRARDFLSLCRRLEQVTTDYDILDTALEFIEGNLDFYRSTFGQRNIARRASSEATAPLSNNAHFLIKDAMSHLRREISLIRSYNRLYRERARIGINECFAMVSQQDAEQNNRTALESARIAQASREDNVSLRSIQLITMFFLPTSFVSSFFGMGFFSTQRIDTGSVLFIVSDKWWMWLIASVPLTILCFVVVRFITHRNTQKQ